MEIRVGVRNVTRELTFESDQTRDEVREAITAGLSAESGVVELQDDHGRVVLVPASALGYVEIGVVEKSKVGFGSR